MICLISPLSHTEFEEKQRKMDKDKQIAFGENKFCFTKGSKLLLEVNVLYSLNASQQNYFFFTTSYL